jgi:hypothetical protein
MKVNRVVPSCAAAVCAALISSAASAAVVVATDNQFGASPFVPTYTPSATDLLNGLLPSAQAGNFSQEFAAGTAVLTNGLFGPISREPANPGNPAGDQAAQTARNANFATGGNTGGTSVTYTLPAPANLTGITVYGGWQDSGRDQQAYSISYATAANPGTFVPLTGATVDFNPGGVPGTTPSATRVTFTDNAGLLAGNVAALRFDFNATENGYAGYTEIDAFGTAVPEPATLGLIGIATLGTLRRRRRAF